MKKTVFIPALFLLSLVACKKTNDSAPSQISLTPSTTTATVGETVSVTLSSNANASKWTVTPATATKAYAVTTSKVNYFTFNEPGVYTVAVSSRAIAFDSTGNQSLDSSWNHTHHGSCVNGVDSTSVNINVVK
jgi:hypothetical protein